MSIQARLHALTSDGDRQAGLRRWIPLVAAVVLIASLIAAVIIVPGHANRRATDRILATTARADRSGFYTLDLRLSLVDAAGAARATEATAEVDVDSDRSHVRLPPVISPEQLEVVSQGPIMFLSVPPDRQPAVEGARWVRVNAGTVGAARGAGVGPLPDPLSIYAALQGVTGKVAHKGTRDLDGTEVTRYGITVSIDKMAERVGPEGAARIRSLKRLGQDRLKGEAWLDDDGRARYVALTAELGSEGRVVAQLRVDGFGTPLLIGIPPNDAVRPATTFSEALALAGAGPAQP